MRTRASPAGPLIPQTASAPLESVNPLTLSGAENPGILDLGTPLARKIRENRIYVTIYKNREKGLLSPL